MKESPSAIFLLFGWNNRHSYLSFISQEFTDAVDACKIQEENEFSNCVKKNFTQTSST